MLASFYARMSKAILAADVAGVSILQWDDSVNALAERNREMRASWQGDLFARFVVFAGTPFLAHYFATVPGLADAEGAQPVVWVDSYEEGYALPLASNVDRFFDLYASYLEALVAHEDYAERGSARRSAFPGPFRTWSRATSASFSSSRKAASTSPRLATMPVPGHSKSAKPVDASCDVRPTLCP